MKQAFEVVLKEDVQKIFDEFSLLFNIPILFWTPTGEVACVTHNWPATTYCRLIQERLYGLKVCQDEGRIRREEAANKGQMTCYTCHAGLTEAIKPIYFDETLIGFIIVGQMRSEETVPERVMNDWSEKHHAEELSAAYTTLPCLTRDRLNLILDLFSMLADYILLRRWIAVKDSSIVDEVVSYLESHVQDKVSLAEISRAFYKGPWTLHQLLKKELSKSFKQIFIEIKLRKAEEYMAANPSATVGEAAVRVGYSDSLYFSRVYKRYRGVSPSEFRAKSRTTVDSVQDGEDGMGELTSGGAASSGGGAR